VHANLKQRTWLRAACLAAAYLLVIQAALSGMALTKAVAHGSDPFSIFCNGDPDSAPAEDGVPAKSMLHCPLCMLATTAFGVVPSVAEVPQIVSFAVNQLHFVSANACVSLHRARAGLSRGPPKIV